MTDLYIDHTSTSRQLMYVLSCDNMQMDIINCGICRIIGMSYHDVATWWSPSYLGRIRYIQFIQIYMPAWYTEHMHVIKSSYVYLGKRVKEKHREPSVRKTDSLTNNSTSMDECLMLDIRSSKYAFPNVEICVLLQPWQMLVRFQHDFHTSTPKSNENWKPKWIIALRWISCWTL